MEHDGRLFGLPKQLGARVLLLSGAVLLSSSAATAQAAAPVVYLYDVRVTGTLRTIQALPKQPLRNDVAYSQISKWTETYKSVRLEVQTSELEKPTITLHMAGKGTVTGSIRYTLSGPRVKSCDLSSTRPEPASLTIGGNGFADAGPGAVTYSLRLHTGRAGNGPVFRSATCAYLEGNSATFSGARITPGNGAASGYIDSRKSVFTIDFRTPQQPGQFGFPLNRMHAGGGFTLTIRAKTKDGQKTSEGTARVTFVRRR